jgi:hypothetical protein
VLVENTKLNADATQLQRYSTWLNSSVESRAISYLQHVPVQRHTASFAYLAHMLNSMLGTVNSIQLLGWGTAISINIVGGPRELAGKRGGFRHEHRLVTIAMHGERLQQ